MFVSTRLKKTLAGLLLALFSILLAGAVRISGEADGHHSGEISERNAWKTFLSAAGGNLEGAEKAAWDSLASSDPVFMLCANTCTMRAVEEAPEK